jgi:hypothetical protein
MTEFFLAPHVHFCCRGGAFVFLDLKQDDYTLVNGRAAAALQQLSTQGHLNNAQPELADALEELVEGGLLTTDPNAGKSIRSTQAEIALEPLLDPEAFSSIHPRLTHLYHFIAACSIAAARLKWGHIENTVKSVERRKARRAPAAHFDVNKARELTAIFRTLRSLFPRDYLCLYDSLALLEFLARFDIYPTWVFGIRLEPWVAHCWVQQGKFVFNEEVEEAAGYTPIMTV